MSNIPKKGKDLGNNITNSRQVNWVTTITATEEETIIREEITVTTLVTLELIKMLQLQVSYQSLTLY